MPGDGMFNGGPTKKVENILSPEYRSKLEGMGFRFVRDTNESDGKRYQGQVFQAPSGREFLFSESKIEPGAFIYTKEEEGKEWEEAVEGWGAVTPSEVKGKMEGEKEEIHIRSARRQKFFPMAAESK